MNGPKTNEQFKAALAEVWARTYPVLLKRIETIEGVIPEFTEPPPSAEQITRGREEAHKLAGVLGTFGLDQGSKLARELEARLEGAQGDLDTRTIATLLAELRCVMEGGRNPTEHPTPS